MSASKMPARIWVGTRTGWTADRTALFEKDTVYIRADIVEAMAGALKLISDGRPENPIGDPWSFYDDLAQIASAALNSYREASNEKA